MTMQSPETPKQPSEKSEQPVFSPREIINKTVKLTEKAVFAAMSEEEKNQLEKDYKLLLKTFSKSPVLPMKKTQLVEKYCQEYEKIIAKALSEFISNLQGSKTISQIEKIKLELEKMQTDSVNWNTAIMPKMLKKVINLEKKLKLQVWLSAT